MTVLRRRQGEWFRRAPGLAERFRTFDGLRGLAILLLTAAAALSSGQPSALNPAQLPSGVLGFAELVGFALFLVLSGYLLTAHLWTAMHGPPERRQRRWLLNFYISRALRLLPLYDAIMLLATMLAVARGTRLSDLGPLKLYTWFIGNLPFLAANAEQQPSPLPIGHFWAIAVVVQLTCAWPLLLWATQGGRRRALSLATGLAGLSMAFCCAIWAFPFWLGVARSHLFDLFPLTYAAPFALGAALALLYGSSRWRALRRSLRGAFALGCAACLLALVLRQTLLPGARIVFVLGFPASGLACAAGMALLLWRDRPARWLENPALVWLGRLSYGIFLLHPVVLPAASSLASHLLRGHPAVVPAARLAISLPVAALVAFLSYELLEVPALRLRERLHLR